MAQDQDIEFMNRMQLKAEIIRLRNGIRKDRDASGHNLCWYRPELWSLIPEEYGLLPSVPPTDEFLEKCREYRQRLDSTIMGIQCENPPNTPAPDAQAP